MTTNSNTSAKVLDLNKKLELSLTKVNATSLPQMNTHLAIDCSGSMHEEYRDGLVQNIIDRFLIAAMKFDSDGKLEVGTFNTSFHHQARAQISDVETYVSKNRLSARGGTNYAPVIEDFVLSAEKPAAKVGGMLSRMFGKKEADAAPSPKNYFGMITDGDCNDHASFEKALAKVPNNSYLQIIAIGNEVNLPYLQGISARLDFVDLIHFPNPKAVTDQDFYDAICHEEMVTWAQKA